MFHDNNRFNSSERLSRHALSSRSWGGAGGALRDETKKEASRETVTVGPSRDQK